MCTSNTASGCDCRCECDILLREDRDMCPEHGTPKPRRISVGRTRPLYDIYCCSSALDKIEDILNQTMLTGEFCNRQQGIMRWALLKCRGLASDRRELGVAEL
jgi:hypothetical protein